jgi:hypothetical protein
MYSIADKVLRRIRARGTGYVFTPGAFSDLGPNTAVRQALSRLVRRGKIRRLDHGIYDYPRVSSRLGSLSPEPDAVARVLAKRSGTRLQVSGVTAANILGLSTQVPGKLVYYTDGPSRRVRVGNQVISFRHAAPRYLRSAGRMTGTVLQALRHLGPKGVDQKVIDTLASTLSASDKVALRREAPHAPDWIRRVIARVAGSPEDARE